VLPIKNLALSGQLQIIIQGIIQGIEFACFWPQFWDLQTLKRQASVVGGCGGTITAHMDSFCCVQGGTILGTKDTCVPKNLEPNTSDPPYLCTPNPPIHQLFLSKSTRASLGIFGPQHTSLLAQG